LRNRIIQEVNTDLGTPVATGQTVFFKPDGVTLLRDADICSVQLGSQSTVLHNPSLNVFEKELIELKRDIGHLRSSIASPRMYRQLIERKRSDLWRYYAAMFRKALPDSVAEIYRFSKVERCYIKYIQPRSWCEFILFVGDLVLVEDRHKTLPTFWSILEGEEEGDVSKVIYSLPSMEVFLSFVRSTGAYADLFADIYGITVEDCLTRGMGVELDSGYADDLRP
jgi:hypothetical protein